MKINWKVRLKKKSFWVTFVPSLMAVAISVFEIFGIDITQQTAQITAVIMSILGVLASLGVIVDPTTKGLEDSDMAMQYEVPKDAELETVFRPKDYTKVSIEEQVVDQEVPDYSDGGSAPIELSEEELDLSHEEAILEGDVEDE